MWQYNRGGLTVLMMVFFILAWVSPIMAADVPDPTACDGDGAVVANGTTHDFITLSTSATSGERFDIVSDGTRMHCMGWAVDVSDTLFATAAG